MIYENDDIIELKVCNWLWLLNIIVQTRLMKIVIMMLIISRGYNCGDWFIDVLFDYLVCINWERGTSVE